MVPDWKVTAFEAGEISYQVYACYECGRAEGDFGKKCTARMEVGEDPTGNECPKLKASTVNEKTVAAVAA